MRALCRKECETEDDIGCQDMNSITLDPSLHARLTQLIDVAQRCAFARIIRWVPSVSELFAQVFPQALTALTGNIYDTRDIDPWAWNVCPGHTSAPFPRLLCPPSTPGCFIRCLVSFADHRSSLRSTGLPAPGRIYPPCPSLSRSYRPVAMSTPHTPRVLSVTQSSTLCLYTHPPACLPFACRHPLGVAVSPSRVGCTFRRSF